MVLEGQEGCEEQCGPRKNLRGKDTTAGLGRGGPGSAKARKPASARLLPRYPPSLCPLWPRAPEELLPGVPVLSGPRGRLLSHLVEEGLCRGCGHEGNSGVVPTALDREEVTGDVSSTWPGRLSPLVLSRPGRQLAGKPGTTFPSLGLCVPIGKTTGLDIDLCFSNGWVPPPPTSRFLK